MRRIAPAATALRVRATSGPLLILHDTTEFSFERSSPEKIGFTNVSTGHKLKDGRHRKHMICGLLMHASLAITSEGLPLGLGGYLDRNNDPPPGTTVIWRGFSRLADLTDGFQAANPVARQFVGN